MQSVNSETVKQAPAEIMVQLVKCVQRLVTTLKVDDEKITPFRF